MSSRIILLGKILLSMVLLYLALSHVPLSGLGRTLEMVKSVPALTALAIAGIAWCVVAMKWRVLLPANTITFSQALRVTFVGIAYGYLLPGGQIAGEVGKFMHIPRHHTTTKATYVLSIAGDKIIGLVATLCIGFISSLAVPSVPYQIKIGFAIIVGALLIMLGVMRIPALRMFGYRIVRKLLSRFKTFSGLVLLDGSLTLPLKKMARSFTLSLINQCLIALSFWFLARSVNVDISYGAMLWISCTISIFLAFPIHYAGFGVREISFISLLSAYNVTSDHAVALSFMVFAMTFIASCIGLVIILSDFAKPKPAP